MSGPVAARLALAVLALWAARRSRRPRGLALAALAGVTAAFGPGPLPLPSPAELSGGVLVAALVLTLVRADLHSPLTSEAAGSTAAAATGAAVVAVLALRGAGLEGALAGGGAVLAALSVWGANGSLANAEAGWRRWAGWGGAVALPAAVAAALVALHGAVPAGSAFLAPATGLVVAVLAWVPPILLERSRVRLELAEEARLGILPQEDLAVLASPWRRSRERRFGRADERRAYVRSALLLAVARQQQRRRSGEAIRLRQLEVLAFRTRVRRAVDARSARFAPVPDEPVI